MRVIAASLWLALAACAPAAPDAPAGKPEVALLTSLPILFGEEFSLEPPPSPLRDKLEARYKLSAVDGPEQLAAGGTLLAIQPQALTAERLVALDEWLRAGGRLVLLADPELSFESSRPLGDRFRPPFTYPDTGLLRRWGLRLEAPADGARPADLTELGEGARLEGARFGTLQRLGEGCTVADNGVIARCKIGRGRLTVVADADFAISPEPGNQDAVIALVEGVRRR